MKNKNDLKQVVRFQGEFDISSIKKTLDKLQSEINVSSVGKTLAANMQAQLNSIIAKADKLQTILGQGFTNTSDITKSKAQFQELRVQMELLTKQYQKINLSRQNMAASNLRGEDVKEFNRLKTEIAAANYELKKFAQSKKTLFDSGALGVSQSFAKQLTSALGGDKKEFKQVFDNEFRRIQERYTERAGLNMNVGNQKDSSTHQNLEKIKKSLEEIKRLSDTAFQEIDAGGDIETIRKKLISDANKRGFSFGGDTTVDEIRKKINVAAEGEARLRNLSNQRGTIENIRIKALQEQQQLIDRERGLTEQRNRLLLNGTQNLENSIRSGGNSLSEELDNNTSSMYQYFNATENAASIQQKFNKTFDGLKDKVVLLFSLKTAMDGIRRVIIDTYHSVTELDKRLASIAMVTDYSLFEMWGQYNNYSAMAQELGQKTKDVISSSALFMQQGLDLNKAFALTTETMRLATLEGGSFEQATSEMTAALRGFKMEMTEGQKVTDVYSELAAKAAADVQGIAYAISKSASIAESAGMSFENTSAFITKMIETTQEAPRTATFLYS